MKFFQSQTCIQNGNRSPTMFVHLDSTRRSKWKNINFTNACQLQRVNFFTPDSKEKLIITVKILHDPACTNISYSDELEQEGPGIHPPTCTLKCTGPTFVVRLSLHHLDFKRIIPKCVLQNQGEKLRLDGRDAFQQCIQRDGLFTFIPVRKPLHQCADLVSKKRVMCWFHVAR